MHVPINVKSPNNISEWQMGFNSAFKGLIHHDSVLIPTSLSPENGRSPHGYINQRLKIQFRAPDDERCAARNMLSLQ